MGQEESTGGAGAIPSAAELEFRRYEARLGFCGQALNGC
jgi:hypothetical protein